MAQVFFSYTPACRRNDYSLFHYGFLQHRDPPRLCALDTPGGSLYTQSGLEEDRDYGAIVTRLCLLLEYRTLDAPMRTH